MMGAIAPAPPIACERLTSTRATATRPRLFVRVDMIGLDPSTRTLRDHAASGLRVGTHIPEALGAASLLWHHVRIGWAQKAWLA